MYFASDNAGPVHPQVIDALARNNAGHVMAYGADALTAEVQDKIRALFEAPDAAVYLVATGTAANALTLSTLSQPWETIFCSPHAHIHEDECNAPEFYGAGTKLTLVPGDVKMTPQALEAAILGEETRGVHGPQRGPVSFTQATERGTVYSPDELTALTDVARRYALATHMDGARFANALVSLNCSPAEMTWKAGIDAVCFGGTKNGLMGVEAVIFFDPGYAREFELRRKRAAHLFSKHRFLSAQMAAYLTDDLWLQSARSANAKAARLSAALVASGADLAHPTDANMVFARLPRARHRTLFDAGAHYHLWDGTLDGPDEDMLTARFVCDWSLADEDLERFVTLLDP